MKTFKTANELVTAINTPKKEGGLASPPELLLRKKEWQSGRHTYVVSNKLKVKYGFDDVVVEMNEEDDVNLGLPNSLPFTSATVNGKFWGATGHWYTEQVYQWEVVEVIRSAGFVYESDAVFAGTKNEAEAFIRKNK